MLRKSGMILLALVAILAWANLALAADGCANCPKAKAGKDCGAECKAKGGPGCAECKDSGAACSCSKAKSGAEQTAPVTATTCPGCGMEGGLCAHCQASCKAMMTKMAGDMCPNCTADKLCADCSKMIDAALVALPKLAVSLETVEPMTVAYMAGKASDDMAQLITSAVTAAGQQGLLNDDTHVGCLFPDVMAKGYNPDTDVYACVSLPEDATVAEPLMTFTIPAGNYMQVEHWGAYENSGVTWMAALSYAQLHGYTLGTGPSGEIFVTDPSTEPVEKWLTYIYIPVESTGNEAVAGAGTANS